MTNLQAAVAPPSSSETEGRIPEHSPLRLVAGTATVSPLQIGKLNQEGQEESSPVPGWAQTHGQALSPRCSPPGLRPRPPGWRRALLPHQPLLIAGEWAGIVCPPAPQNSTDGGCIRGQGERGAHTVAGEKSGPLEEGQALNFP